MADRCSKHNDTKYESKNQRRSLWVLGAVAISSAFWIAFRCIRKPSRITYPCQQASISNIQIFYAVLLASLPSIAGIQAVLGRSKPIVVLGMLCVGSVFLTSEMIGPELGYDLAIAQPEFGVPLVLESHSALVDEGTSDVFLVQNASGMNGNMDDAVSTLFSMMESEGISFYQNASAPLGLIGGNDAIILKVNGQWPYRGGTNTDLVKSVITAIVNHPDGFTGEIVIADNGQGQGSMTYEDANSFHHNQSNQEVADMFESYDVSTLVWDTLRSSTVDDYNDADFTDGYVRSNVWNDDTQIYTSYPKFKTVYGTYISFKNGVWQNGTGFDSNRLKVINMPVMKTHFRYGVTGCIKHYMGLPQGHVVSAVHPTIPHEHFAIGQGGMGTLMAETRFPVLNILDMTWVNANPLESTYWSGPWSYYDTATYANIVGISQDPVALDYWASKNILIPTAQYLEFENYSSLDPDYAPLSDPWRSQEMDESFHNYLQRSMNELTDNGYQATMNQSEINVHVTILTHPVFTTLPSTTGSTTTSTGPTTTETTSTTTTSGTPPPGPSDGPILMIIAGVGFVCLILVGGVVAKKRSQ
ncbi:MAG: DUF362 domain-containing protein [Candidatus Thorarchaeota archaeon]